MKTTSWDQIKAILRSLGNTLNKRIAEVASVAQMALNKANSASDTALKKMNAHNPTGTGSFSMGRKENSYIGDSSFAEGIDTTASGEAAHAEGSITQANGVCSHAEGYLARANGNYSHAEGYMVQADGHHSHAEGSSTQANEDYSHAEGRSTQTNGICSHAEGYYTQADGHYSHAEGHYTQANGSYSHVQGRFNIKDTNDRYAHIVGNGENSSNRSNAHTLDWEGTAWYPAVKIGGTSEDDARDVGAAIDALETEMVIQATAMSESDLPDVYYGGDIPQIKTDQIMSLRIVSKTADIECFCETKAQGNSSMTFPKKNQTTKLYTDFTCEEKLKVAFRNWGAQNKFCLKANYNDLSHARNVVSARIWGDMVRTRPDFDSIPELLRTSPNFGAIDGFPVRVFANGVYQGRYSFNIPKDKWMANMDDENPNHCILCGENYYSGCFREAAVIDGNDWTDEIHDVVPENILTRWNECISFVMNSTDDEFKANLHQYFNVTSLIDYHIFGLACCHMDGFGKNQLFLTYDGQVWYASVYDMDATWGNHYMGSQLIDASTARTSYEDYTSSGSTGQGHLLYVRLEALFADEIKERWNSVKTTALSLSNILRNFEQWASICPPWMIAEDYAETTAEGAFVDMPGKDYNNIQQIRAFAKARHAWTEAYINGEPTVNLWNISERTLILNPFSATKDRAPNYEIDMEEFILSGSRSGYMVGNRTVEHTLDGNNITYKVPESGVGLFMPIALTPGKTYRLRFTTSDASGTMSVSWYDDTVKYVGNAGALTPNNGLSYEGTFVAGNYPNFAITAVAAGTTLPETITFSGVELVELL